jgi:hypothetical protein
MNIAFIILIVFFTILVVFTICFIVLSFFWATQFRDSIRPDRIVYLPSPVSFIKPVLHSIWKDFGISTYIQQHKVKVYEFGSGQGHVCRLISQEFNQPIIGVDINSLLNINHRWINKRKGITNITVLKTDVFAFAEKGQVIYCYLSSTMLTLLYQKGVFEGNLVMCLKFVIEGVEPTKKYQVHHGFGKVRVYDFR